MGKLIVDSPDATYHYCGSCGGKVSYKDNECSTCGDSFEQKRSFQVGSDFNPQRPLVSQLSIFAKSDVSNESKPAITKKLQVSSDNALFFYCKNCRRTTSRKSIECNSCGAFFEDVIKMDSEATYVNSIDSQENQLSDDWEKPATIQPAKNFVTNAQLNPHHGAQYAGFWRRAIAYCIDLIFIMILGAIVGAILGGMFPDFILSLSDGAFNLIGLIIAWLYYAHWESSEKQATIGKIALNIKVINRAGNRLSFGNASGRFFGKIVSGLILGIGFLMAAFTQHKQALHDIISDCYLIIEK